MLDAKLMFYIYLDSHALKDKEKYIVETESGTMFYSMLLQ